MNKEQLVELAELLLDTNDDLEVALSELGVHGGSWCRSYNEQEEFYNETRAGLARLGVYQCQDSGEWYRKRKSRARAV